MILNVVHININVTDIERSIAFYRKLGFEVMHVFGDDPSDVRAGMSSREGKVRGAVMSLGDDPRSTTKIELLEWVEPRGEPQPARTMQQAGVGRIALRTKNLLAFAEKLRAEGIEFDHEPREIDIVGAKRFVVFRDPDGTLLELIEF